MESIDIFLSGVERLLGSSFLNSDKEIKNFLMTISGEEKLREVVEKNSIPISAKTSAPTTKPTLPS